MARPRSPRVVARWDGSALVNLVFTIKLYRRMIEELDARQQQTTARRDASKDSKAL
jgi:hypothetical protein